MGSEMCIRDSLGIVRGWNLLQPEVKLLVNECSLNRVRLNPYERGYLKQFLEAIGINYFLLIRTSDNMILQMRQTPDGGSKFEAVPFENHLISNSCSWWTRTWDNGIENKRTGINFKIGEVN